MISTSNRICRVVSFLGTSGSSGCSFQFADLKQYAMKEQKKKLDNFNKEYSGSVEQIVKRRQTQQKFLTLEGEKQKDLDIFIEAYSDTVIEFKLYGDHYDYNTQKFDALLNYYQVSYMRMFNPIYHLRIQAQFPDQLKDNMFPLLRINISLEPAQFIGAQKAEQWLIDQGFILMPKHRTHSAWSTQGIEFAEKTFNEALNKLFWAPRLTFELYWKSHSKSYTEMSRRALALTVAKIQLKQIAKNIYQNVKNIRSHTEEYQQARQEVLKLVDQWKGRIENNDYHGGMNPDEADFAMYGVLMAKYNSKSFQRFIENHWPAPVRYWLVRMQQNCQYEKRMLYN